MSSVIINGTSGNDTITVDSNNQYTVNALAGNDLIKTSLNTNVGGTYVGNSNNYYGGDGSDTIEITGSNSWAAFQAFNSGNSIETIKGDGSNDCIVAGQNVSTGNAYGPLDLSSTTLVNIAQIRGTSAADDITGSTGADNILAGDGNDIIRESGGADSIDGGTGTNTFIGKSASTSYTPLDKDANGNPVFNSGTNWKFSDSTGTVITLTNIQSVQFTDETLSSTVTNAHTIGQAHLPRMSFIAGEPIAALTTSLSGTDLTTTGKLEAADHPNTLGGTYSRHALEQAATSGLISSRSLHEMQGIGVATLIELHHGHTFTL